MRKKLIYQSWHRGTKEADLILGGFADVYLDKFNEAELQEYSIIINIPDHDLLSWVFHHQPVPEKYDLKVMRLLVAHFSDN